MKGKTLPLIGITSRAMNDKIEKWQTPRQGAIDTMVDSVVEAGGVPVILPLIDNLDFVRPLYEKIDGLIIVGGGDMDPRFYGEESKIDRNRFESDPSTDKLDLALASWAVLDQKPFFGICRGMQVMNVAMGGSLIQDVPTMVETEVDHYEGYNSKEIARLVHDMKVEPDSRLAKILGTTELKVNSLHRQALKRVANDLKVVAKASDGIIEAVEGTTGQYILGIQSHPENVTATDERWQNVYNDFVSAAAKYRDKVEQKTIAN